MKLIAILSQKGGGGKSTLARCLATELTKQKLNILLVDLDIQQKTSQEWAERRKSQGIKKCKYRFWKTFSYSDRVVVYLPGKAAGKSSALFLPSLKQRNLAGGGYRYIWNVQIRYLAGQRAER